MIAVKDIEKHVNAEIEGSDTFLVEVKVSPSNAINVYIDSPNGVGVEACIKLSRSIEEQFDREMEDYSLEVSSPGIGQPFRVFQQYEKVVQKTVEVLFNDGQKQQGTLTKLDEQGFEIEFTVKEKPEGAKRPVEVVKNKRISFDEVKATKEIIIF